MPQIDNSYKLRNQEFLQEYAQKPGVNIMFNGVMYRVLTEGNGPISAPTTAVSRVLPPLCHREGKTRHSTSPISKKANLPLIG